MEFRGSTNLYRKSGFGLHQLRNCLRGDFCSPQPPSRSAGILRKGFIRAFSLLLCTVKRREVRLFLRKSHVGSGCSVCTRSENALVAFDVTLPVAVTESSF